MIAVRRSDFRKTISIHVVFFRSTRIVLRTQEEFSVLIKVKRNRSFLGIGVLKTLSFDENVVGQFVYNLLPNPSIPNH